MNEVDKYISGFTPEIQKVLREIRKIIRNAAPEAKETMNYGIPTYKMGEYLVHFAGYKKHIGFYPTPSGIMAFRKELSLYKSSKGAVQFPLDKPIPYDLIQIITEFRVKEVTQKV